MANYQWKGCANCVVYDWKQADPSTLKKCGKCKVMLLSSHVQSKRAMHVSCVQDGAPFSSLAHVQTKRTIYVFLVCKVVEYCGKLCQEEHWVKVHKNHCKKLSKARGATLLSHHPFPVNGLPGDNSEALVSIIQQILAKMRRDKNVAFMCFSRQLNLLEEQMALNRKEIWLSRKIFPSELPRPDIDTLAYLQIETRNKVPRDAKSPGADIWSSLHLVWRILDDLDTALIVQSFKEPRTASPEELWNGLEEDCSIFTAAVSRIVEACKSQIPSFPELLRKFCGGSLQQACTFCSKRMTVEAICGDVKGSKFGTPEVVLRPCTAMMFNCGSSDCDRKMQGWIDRWNKWQVAALAGHVKHKATKCNLCFKLVPFDQIHR